jgi:hypothetical protein
MPYDTPEAAAYHRVRAARAREIRAAHRALVRHVRDFGMNRTGRRDD